MALYFATVSVNPGENLFSALDRHYAGLTPPLTPPVPTLTRPIPNAVSWLRLKCTTTGVSILGTTSSGTGPVQNLDNFVEFPGGGGRNTINLSGIFLDSLSPVVLDMVFMII